MSTAEVLATVKKMSVQDRVELVEQIYDTIEEDDVSYELTEAEWKEVYRRLRDIEAHPEKGSTWEEVKARIMAKRNDSKSSSTSLRKKKSTPPKIILKHSGKG